MTRNYPQFFAITKAFGLEKDELAQEVSNGRTASLKALTDKEWLSLMSQLQAMQDKTNFTPLPGDVQRKKMISIAYQMNWHILNPADKETDLGRSFINWSAPKIVAYKLDKWAQDQKFKKPLMKHTVQELNILLSIFEEKVFTSYLTDLNK